MVGVTPDIFVGPASADTEPSRTPGLIEGLPYADWLRELLWNTSATHPRSQQSSIGPSQLGLACSRQIGYQIAGTAPVNFSVEPMPSLVGTGMHFWLADVFRRQAPPGRYLVEHSVTYRGVSGTLDLYDRRTASVIDWKFPRRATVRRTLSEGPPRHYLWQLQTYAAGLQSDGEAPARVAVVYVPVDGSLTDVAAWSYPVNTAQADDAIDRLETVRRELAAAEHPGALPAQPSRLCPWCPYQRPGWTGDLDTACPGQTT